MDKPSDSIMATHLLNNTSLRLLPRRERDRIAESLDNARSFDDLPPDVARLVEDAMLEDAAPASPRAGGNTG